MNKTRDNEHTCSSITGALGRIAGPAILVIAGITMLSIGWRKWPDALIDFGRELYVPWQLSEGQILYRDIAYFNGPLSPYFNALVFKLLGVGLMSLAWINIAILAGLTGILYRLLCSVGLRLSATLGCAALLVVFGLGQFVKIGNYNFVCPYSHEMTHGLVLSMAAIYLLHCYFQKRKLIHLGLSGLCLGLVLLTKVEIFLAASSALGVGWILILWQERPALPRMAKLLGLFTAGLVIPLVCFLTYFSLHIGPGLSLKSIFASYVALSDANLTGQKFYRATMGLDQPVENLLAMLEMAGWYLLIVGPLLFLEYLIRSRKLLHKFSRPIMFAVGLILGLLLFRVGTWFDSSRIEPKFAFYLLRPLPLFMLTIGLILLTALCRRKKETERRRLMITLVLTVFSLALLAKIILNAQAYHYGFVLAAPAGILLVVVLLDWPGILGRPGLSGHVFKPAILALLIVALAWHFNTSRRILAVRTHQVGTGPDAFFVAKFPKSQAVSQAVQAITSNTKPEQTFVVFPEGIMLNYLSRRRNPTRHISFMPAEMAIFGGQTQMLADLKENPPDYILHLPRNLREYGYEGFGTDYGEELTQWVDANYRDSNSLVHEGRRIAYPFEIRARVRP